MGSLNYYKGGGPIFEFETNKKLKVEDFSYSMIVFLLDDDEITLMDDFYFNKTKFENTDMVESRGKNGFIKIWKQNGEVFEVNV